MIWDPYFRKPPHDLLWWQNMAITSGYLGRNPMFAFPTGAGWERHTFGAQCGYGGAASAAEYHADLGKCSDCQVPEGTLVVLPMKIKAHSQHAVVQVQVHQVDDFLWSQLSHVAAVPSAASMMHAVGGFWTGCYGSSDAASLIMSSSLDTANDSADCWNEEQVFQVSMKFNEQDVGQSSLFSCTQRPSTFW